MIEKQVYFTIVILIIIFYNDFHARDNDKKRKEKV